MVAFAAATIGLIVSIGLMYKLVSKNKSAKVRI